MWHYLGDVFVTQGMRCESIFGVMQGISSYFYKHQLPASRSDVVKAVAALQLVRECIAMRISGVKQNMKRVVLVTL